MNYKLTTQFFLTPNAYLRNQKDYYKEKRRKNYPMHSLQNMPRVTAPWWWSSNEIWNGFTLQKVFLQIFSETEKELSRKTEDSVVGPYFSIAWKRHFGGAKQGAKAQIWVSWMTHVHPWPYKWGPSAPNMWSDFPTAKTSLNSLLLPRAVPCKQNFLQWQNSLYLSCPMG